MKTITIQALNLSNFKGCETLALVLDERNAAIYGDNATGKTTVYDAMTWLLFGKDSRGSSDQETIKPLDGTGAVKDHQAVTTVEAVLMVDGSTTVTLRKEMQESWVTRRGGSDLVYDGNDFRYYIDGVPMKKMEYAKRVAELVEEDIFRMLTSVTAFAVDLPWRRRREILHDLSNVQVMSDRALLQEAAKDDPEHATGYENLAEQLTGSISLDDLKKILLSRKKGLMQTRDQTPARLDELTKQRNPLALLNFEAASQARSEAAAELERLQEQVRKFQAGESTPELEAALQEVNAKLGDLELRLLSWKHKRAADRRHIFDRLQAAISKYADAEVAIANDARKAREALEDLEYRNKKWHRDQENKMPNTDAILREMRDLEFSIGHWRNQIQQNEAEAFAAEANVEAARLRWSQVSQETFSGATCPTCGQELPMELMQEARAKFEADKEKRLAIIREDAERQKAYAKSCREKAENAKAEKANRESLLDEVKERLHAAQAATEEIRDLDGYAEQKAALEARLEVLNQAKPDPALTEDVHRIEEELAAFDAVTEFPGYGEEKASLDQEKSRVRGEIFRIQEAAANQAGSFEELAEAAKKKIEEADGILAKKPFLVSIDGRIDELRKEQKNAGEALETIDAAIYAMEAFVRWKTHHIEDSINGLFRIVKFRLFIELASGGLEERCDVVVDGVPYAAINNGARINAGLDIIRRLGEHYNVRVPLFVDNAESVTKLEDAGTQVIRLVVSEQDKNLRVELE